MKRIYTIFFLFLSALPIFGQADDLGSWTAFQFTKVFDRSYAMFRSEYRSYQNIGATECWFLMAGGGYNLTKWLKADLSYEFWKIPSAENNPTFHKGVLAFTGTLKRDELSFALREKYEFTYNQQSAIVTNILRSRLRAQYKIGKFTPYLMYEFFNGFEGEGWIRSLHYIGSELSLGKHHVIDFFYMYHLHGNGGCHTIGLNYNLTF